MEITRENVKFNFECIMEPSTFLVNASVSATEGSLKVDGRLEVHYVHPQNSTDKSTIEWRLNIYGRTAGEGKTDRFTADRGDLDGFLQNAISQSTRLMNCALQEKVERTSRLVDKQSREEQARTAIWKALEDFWA